MPSFSEFGVHNTLPGLQCDFCALCNEMSLKVRNSWGSAPYKHIENCLRLRRRRRGGRSQCRVKTELTTGASKQRPDSLTCWDSQCREVIDDHAGLLLVWVSSCT